MKTTFTAADEIQARGLSVDLKCEGCEAARGMDELNREQISRMRDELHCNEFRYLKNIRGVTEELGRQRARKDHWRLGCFAGWFTVAMFIVSEIWK